MSDIEQGERNAPTEEFLDKIIKELNLKDDEIKTFYDLAREGKAVPIAEDVKEILTGNQDMPVLCRVFKEENVDIKKLIMVRGPIRKDYKKLEIEYLRLEPEKSIDNKGQNAISDPLYSKWGD